MEKAPLNLTPEDVRNYRKQIKHLGRKFNKKILQQKNGTKTKKELARILCELDVRGYKPDVEVDAAGFLKNIAFIGHGVKFIAQI